MQILTSQQIDLEKWKSLVSENVFASPFQSPEYYSFFNSVPGMSARVFAVDGPGELLALCVVTMQKEKGVRGYFSRRAIIYGGALIAAGGKGKKALTLLCSHITEAIKKEGIYAEIRNLHDLSEYKEAFLQNGWRFEPHINYHLDCRSETVVWKNLNSNRSRQIKKALKIGVEIKEACGTDEVRHFYEILNGLYREKIKKPLPAIEFFLNFYEQNLGKYLLVHYKDEIIGGIMCPVLQHKAIYEFYICGKDREYKEASPSVMATYAAIQYGFQHDLKYFDFMGAGKPDEDYGVREFKSKFGGTLVEHGRYLRIFNPLLFSFGKRALKVIQKIK